MTPAVLQALSPAAPAASARQAVPAAPGDAPASFADTLDASVQARSGAGGPQPAAAPEALATEQPRLDAMAMMLAAALPATDAGRRAAPGDGHASITAALDVSGQAPTGAGRDADEPQGAAAPEALATGQARLDAMALMLAAAPALPGQGTPAPGTGLPGTGPQALAAAPEAGQEARTAAALAGPRAAAAPADPPPPLAVGAPAAPRTEVPAPHGEWRHVSGTLAATSEATLDIDVGGPSPPPATVAAAAPPAAPSGATSTPTARDVGALAAAPSAASALPPAATPRAPIELQSDPAAPCATLAPDVELVAAREASPAPPQAPPAGGLPALTVAAGPAAPGTVAHLAPPVGTPGWAPALAQQIVRLPGGGEVELHLNPAELGPLQVKLSLVESQAQVLFVTEHAAVRHALEAALPQLRTGLAESGINLGQATVGSGAGEQRTGQDGGERPAPGDERGPAKPHGAAVRSGHAGAVDTFA